MKRHLIAAFMLALAAALPANTGAGKPVTGGRRALIIYNGDVAYDANIVNAFNGLLSLLTSAGAYAGTGFNFTVETVSVPIASNTGQTWASATDSVASRASMALTAANYCVIFDMRFANVNIVGGAGAEGTNYVRGDTIIQSDVNSYAAYLASGGGLFIMGDNYYSDATAGVDGFVSRMETMYRMINQVAATGIGPDSHGFKVGPATGTATNAGVNPYTLESDYNNLAGLSVPTTDYSGYLDSSRQGSAQKWGIMTGQPNQLMGLAWQGAALSAAYSAGRMAYWADASGMNNWSTGGGNMTQFMENATDFLFNDTCCTVPGGLCAAGPNVVDTTNNPVISCFQSNADGYTLPTGAGGWTNTADDNTSGGGSLKNTVNLCSDNTVFQRLIASTDISLYSQLCFSMKQSSGAAMSFQIWNQGFGVQITAGFTIPAGAGWTPVCVTFNGSAAGSTQVNWRAMTAPCAGAIDIFLDDVHMKHSCGSQPMVVDGACCTLTTPTFTPTLTRTPTPSVTYTATLTRTATPTSTYTATLTATPTQSVTSTRTSSPTSSFTATATPTYTATRTATLTATSSFSSTNTITPGSTPTYTATRTNTVTSTYTSTVTLTSTVTFTRTFTATATFSSTYTPTATFTLTTTPSLTPTQTFTNSKTITPGSTPTFTVTRTETPTVTYTSTLTSTPSQTLTRSPTLTATATLSSSPTISPGPSSTSTFTTTMSSTVTMTPTYTLTRTPTLTPTSTFTNTDTITPGPSPTFTSTYSMTQTPTPTKTVTVTSTSTSPNTPSFTATETQTATTTPSRTVTATSSLTSTRSITATNTPSLTATRSSTPTYTASPTVTFTLTRTVTPSRTPSLTASATPIPMPFHLTLSAYNSAGELVRTIYSGGINVLPGDLNVDQNALALGGAGLNINFNGLLANGASSLNWDGSNNGGQSVDPGTYYIKMETQDSFGKITALIQAVQVSDARPTQFLAIYNSAGERIREIPLPANLALNHIGSASDVLAVGGDDPAAQGKLTLDLRSASGAYSVTWDGKNDAGQLVDGGIYSVVLISRQGIQETRVESKSVQVLRVPTGDLAAQAHAVTNPLGSSSRELKIAYPALAGGSACARLFNLAGEAVADGNDPAASGLLSMPLGQLSGGVYFVNFEIKNGPRVMGRKIIKVAIFR